MLSIVVCLKERNAQVQFKHDAANRPDITWLRPAQLENHFRCAIMTCRYNGAVMLVIEGCAAKINESNVGAFDATNFPILNKQKERKSPDESSTTCRLEISLTFRALNVVVKSELAKRIFSGFRSVCVSLLSCRNFTA